MKQEYYERENIYGSDFTKRILKSRSSKEKETSEGSSETSTESTETTTSSEPKELNVVFTSEPPAILLKVSKRRQMELNLIERGRKQ